MNTNSKTMTQTQPQTTQPLHERIMEEARAMDFPTNLIDLPQVLNLHYDDDGDVYVSDTNKVIRYYLDTNQNGEGQLMPTEDFYSNYEVAVCTERTNSLEKIYNAY